MTNNPFILVIVAMLFVFVSTLIIISLNMVGIVAFQIFMSVVDIQLRLPGHGVWAGHTQVYVYNNLPSYEGHSIHKCRYKSIKVLH